MGEKNGEAKSTQPGIGREADNRISKTGDAKNRNAAIWKNYTNACI